jgi:hypothetical protein
MMPDWKWFLLLLWSGTLVLIAAVALLASAKSVLLG